MLQSVSSLDKKKYKVVNIMIFQKIITTLEEFWANQGCVILTPYDLEMGAGTFHWATTLKALGPEPWKACFVQPSRRPTDGRFGDNPNRLQHFLQLQVVLKPTPVDSQKFFIKSLEQIGLNTDKHDIRFVEDDWESPTLGAAGLGWEVWCDGLEITQFTYFQQMGGIPCKPITTEITYGLERIAMLLQGKDRIMDIQWNEKYTYADIYGESERQFSEYNFKHTNHELMKQQFKTSKAECDRLLKAKLYYPAYNECIKANHLFNLLDSSKAISVVERVNLIADVRILAYNCFSCVLEQMEEKGTINKEAK